MLVEVGIKPGVGVQVKGKCPEEPPVGDKGYLTPKMMSSLSFLLNA